MAVCYKNQKKYNWWHTRNVRFTIKRYKFGDFGLAAFGRNLKNMKYERFIYGIETTQAVSPT